MQSDQNNPISETGNDNIDQMEVGVLFQRYGQALYNNLDQAKQLLADLVQPSPKIKNLLRVKDIFSRALDAARIDGENGLKKGSEYIETLEKNLLALTKEEKLTTEGSFVLSDAWVSAGLTPPECLANSNGNLAKSLDSMTSQDSCELKLLLDGMLKKVNLNDVNCLSHLHVLFEKILPTLLDASKYAIVRMAIAMPEEVFAGLGCSLLLTKSETVCNGAIDGFTDRLKSGKMNSKALGKLTILRSWLQNSGTKSRLDKLVRECMKHGVDNSNENASIEYQSIISSVLDGTGSQSIMIPVQVGNDHAIAIVLLKQGYGVKNAFVYPCRNEAEQRQGISKIGEQLSKIQSFTVPFEYVRDAIGVALHDGAQSGHPPESGLVEFAESVGLFDLRPTDGSMNEILNMIDPEGKIQSLPAEDLMSLVNASETWWERYPMIGYWFESCDETDEILTLEPSNRKKEKRLWSFLEKQRTYWGVCVARTAMLLNAANEESAEEFVAVATAIAKGWDLKRIPLMERILNQTIHIWENDRKVSKFEIRSGVSAFDVESKNGRMGTKGEKLPDLGKLRKQLESKVQSGNKSLNWIDGYLLGVYTSPIEVDFEIWMGMLIENLAMDKANAEHVRECVRSILQYFNAVSLKMSNGIDRSLLPADETGVSEWAAGYLLVWDANPQSWPSELTGPLGEEINSELRETAGNTGEFERTATKLIPWIRRSCEIGQH